MLSDRVPAWTESRNPHFSEATSNTWTWGRQNMSALRQHPSDSKKTNSTVSLFSTSTGCFTKTYKVCASNVASPQMWPKFCFTYCIIPRGLLCFLGASASVLRTAPFRFKVERHNIEGVWFPPQVQHPKSYKYSKLAMAKKNGGAPPQRFIISRTRKYTRLDYTKKVASAKINGRDHIPSNK